MARVKQFDIPLLGVVPHDETAKEFEFSARPLVDRMMIRRCIRRWRG